MKKKVPCRCVAPGTRFHFVVNFWNLTDEELEKLIWSLKLNDNCAHKLGKGKALGLGSCKITIDAQNSHLYNWKDRYATFENLGIKEIPKKFLKITRSQEPNLHKLLNFPDELESNA